MDWPDHDKIGEALMKTIATIIGWLWTPAGWLLKKASSLGVEWLGWYRAITIAVGTIGFYIFQNEPPEEAFSSPQFYLFKGPLLFSALLGIATILVALKTENHAAQIAKSDLLKFNIKSQTFREIFLISVITAPVITLIVPWARLLLKGGIYATFGVMAIVFIYCLAVLILMILGAILFEGWKLIALVSKPILTLSLFLALYLSYQGAQNPGVQSFLVDWWLSINDCSVALGECANTFRQAQKYAPFLAFTLCILPFFVVLMPTAVAIRGSEKSSQTLQKLADSLAQLQDETHTQHSKKHNEVVTVLSSMQEKMEQLLKRPFDGNDSGNTGGSSDDKRQ